MYVTEKDMKILREADMIGLGLRYRELTGGKCPRAFNYEDFPRGAEPYIVYLKELIAELEKNRTGKQNHNNLST